MQSGALFDGDTEQVAKDVIELRKAAIFFCEVEDVVDTEDITEEMKLKPKMLVHTPNGQSHGVEQN